MREIEFRAWDEDEKRYWYFNLQELLERRMAYRGSWDEKVMRGVKEQYIGLRDSKRTEEFPEGQKIFEGDIVKDDCGLLGNVVFSDEEYDGIAGFMVFDVHDGLQNRDGFWHLSEVIGNIHENLDLRGGCE